MYIIKYSADSINWKVVRVGDKSKEFATRKEAEDFAGAYYSSWDWEVVKGM